MPVRLSHGDSRPTAVVALAAVALAALSLVASAAVGSIFLSTARTAWAAITAAGPASPADGILVVVALVGAPLSLWVGLAVALSALSALPGASGQACSQLAARIAPAAIRKVVAFILGTALTAALLPGTALARTGQEAPRHPAVASAQYAVGALGNAADVAPDASFRFVSDTIRTIHDADAAPAPSWSPEMRASSANSAGGVVDVVVHRGDSLWSIAARHLGPAATTVEIDAEWHRWYAANRQVIGRDANVIAPGQVLSPPASAQHQSSTQEIGRAHV